MISKKKHTPVKVTFLGYDKPPAMVRCLGISMDYL
jgi:hypothetical protein